MLTQTDQARNFFDLSPALATRPDITSVLSDLAVVARIPHYRHALPMITKEDAAILISHVEDYMRIDFKRDGKTGGREQKRIIANLRKKLKQIIARKVQ